ncbi:amidohydrolase 2 [Delftia sp. Cs1-4]|uniref:amidohydrolase family protein n=1 Tax=Delftia sp. (strain Cs1-4) TaxID=742013 RepID=UPI00020E7D26|nr:amidohydrolase family protein [Delftia sp. Cs1-4]AEF88670.1 amidohydrolase 2 [Delftia sp. Cs1-4]
MANHSSGGARPTEPLLGGMFQSRQDRSGSTRFGKIYLPDPAWLSKAAPEPVLEPDLAIVDTHHHLWDFPGYRYLLQEFAVDLQTGHKVVATVFNECQAMYRASGPAEMKPVGEVEFCAGVAAMSESGNYGPTRVNAGIVGFADLTLGDRVAPVLEAQIARGGGRFRGVRHAAAWDADPVIGNSHTSPSEGQYRRPEFLTGLRHLTRLGLSLDAWVFYPQMDDVVSVARACPEANIIMCHMGGPLGYGRYANRKDEVFRQWREAMARLAACENVSVKLGGVMMRLAAFDYGQSDAPASSDQLAALWRPYVETCVELFGPRRCVVESNFPVEKMGIGYAALWNTFKKILKGLSPAEKRAVFSETAARVYRLELPQEAEA